MNQEELYKQAIKVKSMYRMPVDILMREMEKFDKAFKREKFPTETHYMKYRRGWLMCADDIYAEIKNALAHN